MSRFFFYVLSTASSARLGSDTGPSGQRPQAGSETLSPTVGEYTVPVYKVQRAAVGRGPTRGSGLSRPQYLHIGGEMN